MAWADSVAILTSRYGSTAKKVAASVVTAMFPGCGIAVQLVESAFEIAKDAAKDHLDAQLIRVTKANSQDIGRLNHMMEHLTGSMAKVCSEAQTMLNNPERIQEMVCKALQDDPTLLKVQRSVDDLAGRFSVIERQNRQLLDGHDEMLPLLRRMSGLANFVDELTASGVTGRDLAQILRQKAEIQQKISHRQGADAIALLHALPASVQTVPSLLTLEAAARVVSHDYGEAVPLLRDAARQKPNDAELGEMWRQVTVVSGMASTPKPSSSGVSIPRVDAGMVLDGYRLESRLGSGGWGQVFRASKNGQVKALKVLHPELSRNPQVLERFKSEIKTLLKLPAHLNLVRVEDFGYCPERACWYLVMEYIDGPTLDQYLRSSKTLNPEQIRRVFQPLAQGLGLAHKAGFVHRDIKPGNMVFRKSDQRLVLIDFGLANHETDAGKEQIDGKTLMFAAPEQLRGKPADARSDVYSLTATMHFAVQYAQADLRDPDHFDADKAPKPLRSVLVGGMETNPQRRFADGADLAEAMIELLVAEVPAPPPAMPEFVAASSAKVQKLKPPVDNRQLAAVPAPLPPEPEFVPASSPKVRKVKRAIGKRAKNQQDLIIATFGVALVVLFLVGLLLFWNSSQQAEVVAGVPTPEEVVQAKLPPVAEKKVPPLAKDEPIKSEAFKSPINSGVEAKKSELSKTPTVPQPKALSKPRTFDLGYGVSLEMVLIPAGTFMMGSPVSEADRKNDETQHEVIISRPFYMGKYEITQAQWQRVMGMNPSHFKDSLNLPVEGVSYVDMQVFCRKLKTITNAPFGLPTEAQWEYACRAGTTTTFHFGNELNGTQASCNGLFPFNTNIKGPFYPKTSPVGKYSANPWGLHDMHGNVWEWCSDWYGNYPKDPSGDPIGVSNGNLRIRRGGSWDSVANRCRAACRNWNIPTYRLDFAGARLCLPLDS